MRRRTFERHFRVVANYEVEKPVAIVVKPGGARRPSPGIPETRIFGDIGEGAIAVVVVEVTIWKSRDQNVLVAIIIKIRDSHTHAIGLGPAQTRLGCDVHKLAIAQIAIKGVLNGFLALPTRCFTAIQKKNIQPSVIVKIEKTDTAAHGLDQVAVGGNSVEMSPGETRLGCDIGENRVHRGRASKKSLREELPNSRPEERGEESAPRGASKQTARALNCVVSSARCSHGIWGVVREVILPLSSACFDFS